MIPQVLETRCEWTAEGVADPARWTVVLSDSEVSRQHASIEVHGSKVVLKDLGSTNGTFVNDQKVTQCEIENRAEFRVGGTVLMLIMTDTGPELEALP